MTISRKATQARVENEAGNVVLKLESLSNPIARLEMTPASARTMASLLIKHAALVERKTGVQTVIVDMGEPDD